MILNPKSESRNSKQARMFKKSNINRDVLNFDHLNFEFISYFGFRNSNLTLGEF